jgi:hypothetical protein
MKIGKHRVDLLSEGENLFVVVDGKPLFMRKGRAGWGCREPGWELHYVDLHDISRNRIIKAIEFSHEDRGLLDHVFFEEDGKPYLCAIKETRRAGSDLKDCITHDKESRSGKT